MTEFFLLISWKVGISFNSQIYPIHYPLSPIPYPVCPVCPSSNFPYPSSFIAYPLSHFPFLISLILYPDMEKGADAWTLSAEIFENC